MHLEKDICGPSTLLCVPTMPLFPSSVCRNTTQPSTTETSTPDTAEGTAA